MMPSFQLSDDLTSLLDFQNHRDCSLAKLFETITEGEVAYFHDNGPL